MKPARNLITPASMKAIRVRVHAVRLPKRTARVYCLGCGKTLLVPAGWEWPALAAMQKHAREHEHQLSKELLAAAKNDPPTNDLIVTMTWGMAAEDVEN